jgi:predicted transcriptional regulator
MKSVLISIQPKWCELIAAGKKTVEVRKTAPKLEPPFKCYIYCTHSGSNEFFKDSLGGDVAAWNRGKWWAKKGKVIGEFVCDRIEGFTPTEKGVAFKRFTALHDTCLSVAEIRAYLGSKVGYGWHISDLVIYDEPKALCDFVMANTQHYCHLQRPPQSWCYVEEV